MKHLIRAAEVWVPDREGQLLEFGGGLYGEATAFAIASRGMCFGRAEGLPGKVWDEARPVLLTDLQAGSFRRATAAAKAGLACAAALPFYFGDALKAVVVLFCGRQEHAVGAIELWHNDPRVTGDMTLAEAFHPGMPEAFAAASRDTFLPRGSGLPGQAWQRDRSVFIDGLTATPGFVRAQAAADAGLVQGLALPCPVPGNEHHVVALLASATAPIARRIEAWEACSDGPGLQRLYGHDALVGTLPTEDRVRSVGEGGDSLATAFASAMPVVALRAADEPGAVGKAAAAAGLGGLLALPIVSDGAVVEVVALYL